MHDFIDNLPLPACAVRLQDGALLHMNRRLRALVRDTVGAAPVRCGWIDRSGKACPDDAETPTVGGRCLFPGSDAPLLLAGAFRLMGHEGTLLRLYAPSERMGHPETVEAVRAAFRYAFDDPSGADTTLPTGNGSRPLAEIVRIALCHPHAAGAPVEIAVPPSVRIPAPGILPLTRLLERLVAEGAALAPRKRLTLSTAREDGRRRRIDLTTERLRLTKGTVSLARAAHLRLAAFATKVATVTRFPLLPPAFALNDGHIRFTILFESENAPPPPAPLLPDVYAALSAREQEVAELIVTGVDPEEIARQLGIRASTVKQHLKNIYEKTGVRNRLELLSLLRAGE